MTRRWKIFLPLVAVILTVAGLLFMKSRRGKEAPEAVVPLGLNEDSMRGIARYGSGFIVWERFKGGSWQIWSKRLQGGREVRLVPAEPGKDHFCPKISPDGKLLAYMSYDVGTSAYPAFRGRSGALSIMNLETRETRVIVPEARSYAEDRAVTWRDGQKLCFINGKGETMEMDLNNGKAHKVLQYHDEDFGYLPSPDLKHATSGTPEFARIEPDGTLQHQKIKDGCQPYFTSDSRWGYWMAGAGGPLRVMNLLTGEEKNVLQRDDSRLPERRNYIYFPMISPGMRLLAFAASSDKHDHFEADYDIYLAVLNPRTMSIMGQPVRYTKFTGCDRFPDVFRTELPLGTHFVEGETTVTFSTPKFNGVFDFDFGDGGSGHGARAGHTFKKPGDYWVKAVSIHKGIKDLRGFVHVDPPTAPEIVEIRRENEQNLIVEFNDHLDLSQARIALEGGAVLTPVLTESGRGMLLKLPTGLPKEASLVLEGVRDAAQVPNTMARKVLPIPRTDWPVLSDGLLFAWNHARAKNQLPNGTECRLVPHGLAFWNENGTTQLRGGWFDAPDAGPRISEACRVSGAFTVEAVFTPQPKGKNREIEPILTLGDTADDTNLVIGQRGYQLCVSLRSQNKKKSGEDISVQEVVNIGPDTGHHLMAIFQKDSVTMYVDGRKRDLPVEFKGALSSWKPQKLRLGATADGAHPWRGLIERVAFYERSFSREEAEASARQAAAVLDARTKTREWTVMAKLVESSPSPTLQEIQPYKEALVRQLYEVQRVLGGSGPLSSKEIVVTQWAWLGGQPMPAQTLKVGDVVKLALHEMEAHRELSSLFVKDSLSSGFDATPYFDVNEWDEAIEKQ